MAILKKTRETFVTTVIELGRGDVNGKQRVVRYMERVIDRRAGAAEAPSFPKLCGSHDRRLGVTESGCNQG